MSGNLVESRYGEAILDHLQTGAYPDSEDIISASLPPGDLSNILKQVKGARLSLEVKTRR